MKSNNKSHFHIPSNQEIIDSYDYLANSASMQDCTGLIPSAPQSKAELESYEDVYHYQPPEEIAKVIAPQFDETDLETITKIVTRYYEQDTWKADLVFEEDSFNLLQDILEDAGELAERAPYKDLVTTEFAEKAIQ